MHQIHTYSNMFLSNFFFKYKYLHISHKKDLTFFIVKIFQEWKNLQVNFANKNFSVVIISFKKFEPFPSKILTLNTNFKEWSFTNFKLTRNLDHSVNNYLLQLHAIATRSFFYKQRIKWNTSVRNSYF